MLIFVRHVFYCDLPTLLGPSLAASFTYINVLREPVARAASVLNWVHERSLAAARQPKPAGDAEWNTPSDHFPKVHDQYIRWHCGFTVFRSQVAGSCDTRQPYYTKRELGLADKVLEHGYAYVGVTEDMAATLCVLAALYPSHLRKLCGVMQPHTHAREVYEYFHPNESDWVELREWNALDSSLYARVRSRHLARVRSLGLNTSLSDSAESFSEEFSEE